VRFKRLMSSEATEVTREKSMKEEPLREKRLTNR
jgi:hypothetical protein